MRACGAHLKRHPCGAHPDTPSCYVFAVGVGFPPPSCLLVCHSDCGCCVFAGIHRSFGPVRVRRRNDMGHRVERTPAKHTCMMVSICQHTELWNLFVNTGHAIIVAHNLLCVRASFMTNARPGQPNNKFEARCWSRIPYPTARSSPACSHRHRTLQ